jgi:hypothetical protein
MGNRCIDEFYVLGVNADVETLQEELELCFKNFDEMELL